MSLHCDVTVNEQYESKTDKDMPDFRVEAGSAQSRTPHVCRHIGLFAYCASDS